MDGILSVELQAQVSNFVKGFREAASESTKAGKAIDKATEGIADAVTSRIAGVFSVAGIVGFGKAVLDVTGEFQKFSAVLGNTLGSQALADLKLKEIQDFAAATPFSVNELTESFVKLANAGFKPTGDQMRKLGDLASSTGKSFDQLAEAILDAQTGEFERLKEFGVRAKDAGDKVIFTYKGVQTQVEKTSGSIRDYITSLGDAQGVSGSMAKISETLQGKISNLGDSWDQMLLSVGGNTSGVFSSAISIISSAITKITQYNNELNKVQKYKLGSASGDFLAQLNRAVNPFASKGATDVENAVFNIKAAEDAVAAFVSKSTAGAKTAKDFGKALGDLKDKANISLSMRTAQTFADEIAKQGLKGTPQDILKSAGTYFIGSKQEAKAIKDVYMNGIKAIQDARTQFLNTPVSDANFGKATGKQVKTIAEVMKELTANLKASDAEFQKTFGEKSELKIRNYQTAISDLAKISGGAATAAINKLQAAQARLLQLPTKESSSPTLVTDATQNSARNSVGQIGSAGIEVKDPTLNAFKKGDDALNKLREFNQKASDILTNGLNEGVGGFASAIGTALANGGSVIDAVGASLLSSLGGVLTSLGKMAIEIGIGLKAIKTALSSLNPVVAIGAGVALVALGSFFSSKASSIGNAVKGGNSSNVTAFADGGIVSGPTLGLMGEYPGAKNNPEVIAPLNKLKAMIGNTGQNSYIADTRIRGEDIVISYTKAKSKLDRT